MKVKIHAQPLIFGFYDSDSLLDCLPALRRSKKRIYPFGKIWYMAAEIRLSERRAALPLLRSRGRYLGRGKVLEAFISEHRP